MGSAESAPTLHGSILILPNLLSKSECDFLWREADHLLDCGGYRRDLVYDEGGSGAEGDSEAGGADDTATRRVSISDMSARAQSLSDIVIMKRVLPTLAREMPSLLRSLELHGFDSASAVFDWAADEPTVNRYTAGGKFGPHRDGYSLTVIVLLSRSDAFEGGGTRFFESARTAASFGGEDSDDELRETDDGLRFSRRGVIRGSAVVKPRQGTAVLFDGLMTHAGCPVCAGARHVYVASLSLGTPA